MVATLDWAPPTAKIYAGYVDSATDDVVELPLLLPEWQVSALVEAAQVRNMTVGQLVRRMFSDAFPRAIHRRG